MKTKPPSVLPEKYSTFYKTWLTAFIIGVVLNVIYFNLHLVKIYNIELKTIARTAKEIPALELQLFVYAFITAFMVFCIPRVVPKQNRQILSVLFGMSIMAVIYGSHNIWNYILFREWAIGLSIMDFSWGVVQGAILGLLIDYLHKRFSY